MARSLLQRPKPLTRVSAITRETPSVVKFKGLYHMFYTGVYAPGGNKQFTIAHAVSTDKGKSFRQDKAPIFVRESFDWTRGEIRSPSALFENGKLRLWFAGMVPVKEFRSLIQNGIKGREFGIGHATIKSDLLGKSN